MRFSLIFLSVFILSCSSPKQKDAIAKIKFDDRIFELVQYFHDSVSTCENWLSKDYRIRKFFDESDSATEVFDSIFSHNDIVDIFESAESITMMDFTPYLDSLKIPHVSHIDSIVNCATAINTAAFMRNGQRALILLVTFEDSIVHTRTFVANKLQNHWHITDTLRENVHARIKN